MYLAIDVGGTKTLLAVFNTSGEIVHEHKFPTNHNYQKFLTDLEIASKAELKDYSIAYCCCAMPGKIDRVRGIVLHCGNLKWQNVAVKEDLHRILKVPVLLENDANLAGLHEALLVQKKYSNVLYVTISTGIGDGIIINGKIDPSFADSEPGHIVMKHDGKLQKWEDFASGRALVQRYGKKAKDLNDASAWKQFAKDVAQGLDELIAILQPQIILIGGSLGTYFHKYGDFLVKELEKYQNTMVSIPPIVQAKRPEEAVVYGCYDFIKQHN
jgi:glucokinase